MKEIELEVRKPDKPLFDNRDMCALLAVICGALATYILYTSGQIVCYSRFQLAGAVISTIFAIAVVLFWATQKIVRLCNKKAQDN